LRFKASSNTNFEKICNYCNSDEVEYEYHKIFQVLAQWRSCGIYPALGKKIMLQSTNKKYRI